MYRRSLQALLLSGLVIAGSATTVRGNAVDIALKVVTSQPLDVGEQIRVDLVLTSSKGTPQAFDALGAVIVWDPTKLELINNDQSFDSANEPYFAGFFPDADVINEVVEPLTPTDGGAYLQAFTFGQTYMAPVAPGEFIATSFIFEALTATGGTEIELVPTMGNFGETRVLMFGAEITGEIGGPVTVTILPIGACCTADGSCQLLAQSECTDENGTYQGDDSDCDPNPCPAPICPADINDDNVVDVNDLLILIGAWGSSDPAADINDDNTVDVNDLLILIGAWGDC